MYTAKRLGTMVVISGLLFGTGAEAEGFFGGLIERGCGNCGLGRSLDRAHDRMGNPLDVPGRIARETAVETAGPLLAEAIRHSRNNARSAGTRPIPSHIKEQLARYYPRELLDRVQYRVGQGHELSVQANSFRFGDAAAVALIDTVVFASSWDATNDDVLWAHEIKHIDQYQRWGLTDFAKRYVRDANAVEAEANRAADEYAQLPVVGSPYAFDSSPLPAQGPLPVRSAEPARICTTHAGQCFMMMQVPTGSACYCTSYYGPIWGVAQ